MQFVAVVALVAFVANVAVVTFITFISLITLVTLEFSKILGLFAYRYVDLFGFLHDCSFFFEGGNGFPLGFIMCFIVMVKKGKAMQFISFTRINEIVQFVSFL